MRNGRILYNLVICFILELVLLWLPKHTQAINGSILLKSAGKVFEIIKTFRDGKKVLNAGMHVLVNKAIYDSLYDDFVDGRLDLQVDKVNTLPRWNWIVREKLIRSELTFQCKMVHFLESNGLIGEKNYPLRALKEALFYEQEAVEDGKNLDEEFFDNIRIQRHLFIQLRSKIGTIGDRQTPLIKSLPNT